MAELVVRQDSESSTGAAIPLPARKPSARRAIKKPPEASTPNQKQRGHGDESDENHEPRRIPNRRPSMMGVKRIPGVQNHRGNTKEKNHELHLTPTRRASVMGTKRVPKQQKENLHPAIQEQGDNHRSAADLLILFQETARSEKALPPDKETVVEVPRVQETEEANLSVNFPPDLALHRKEVRACSSSEIETAVEGGEIAQPGRVLQAMAAAGFPADSPPGLAPHRREAREAAGRAVARALEADAAEGLVRVAAGAARAAAARDPAHAEEARAKRRQAREERQRGASPLEMKAPMKLLPLGVLRAIGRIPRSDEKLAHKLLREFSPEARRESFFVFLSHRWFAPNEDPGKARPDKDGLKFSVMMKAVDIIKAGLKPGTEVYIWVDFYCIDQDNAELKMKGINSLPAYIYNSDCLLTPYTDKVFDNLAPGATYRVPPFNLDGLEQFKSLAVDLTEGYFCRGWCREEMYLATALKVKEGTYQFFLQKGIAPRAEQRPHFLAGDDNDGLPQLLPPLANSVLRALNPAEGCLTSETDRAHLRALMERHPPPPDAPTGYWGERDASGEPEGHGLAVDEGGDRYEGQWRGGLPHGRGAAAFASGDAYAGDWARGEREGAGVWRFAEGNAYRGRWAGGARAGHGVHTYVDGGRHAGGWAGDLKSGPGVHVASDGQRQEGRWERGLEEGLRTLTYPSGDVEVSEWRGGRRHGAYSKRKPDGTVVDEGRYVNGQREG